MKSANKLKIKISKSKSEFLKTTPEGTQGHPKMTSSKKTDLALEHQWEHGWDEHQRMQLQRLASLSLEEKLTWLEEAHRLLIQLGAVPPPRTEDRFPSK